MAMTPKEGLKKMMANTRTRWLWPKLDHNPINAIRWHISDPSGSEEAETSKFLGMLTVRISNKRNFTIELTQCIYWDCFSLFCRFYCIRLFYHHMYYISPIQITHSAKNETINEKSRLNIKNTERRKEKVKWWKARKNSEKFYNRNSPSSPNRLSAVSAWIFLRAGRLGPFLPSSSENTSRKTLLIIGTISAWLYLRSRFRTRSRGSAVGECASCRRHL